MSDWMNRIRTCVRELGRVNEVELLNDLVVAEDLPIDEEYLEDVFDDGGFIVADEMLAYFSAVSELCVEWTHESLESHGSRLVMGRLDVGRLDDIVFSGYVEGDLPLMGPRDERERDYLLRLRHISLHSLSGDSWLALVPDDAGQPTFWWRTNSRDIPLTANFGALLDTMLRARGALGWPLLHADLTGLSVADLRSILHDISGDAAAFRRRLDILASMPECQTDAADFSARLDAIVRASAESLLC